MKKTDSALELVRMKRHPDTVQEEEEAVEFIDFELSEEPSAIIQMLSKFWGGCSQKLSYIVLATAAILLLATAIFKNQLLGVITLTILVCMMAIWFGKIVRSAIEAQNSF